MKFSLLVLCALVIVSCSSRLSKSEHEKLSQESDKKIAETALTHFIDKNYDLAIDTYSIIIARTNADKAYSAWARYETGFCYYYKENFDKAKEHFEILLREFPESEFANQRMLAEMLIKKIDQGLTDGI